MSKTSALPRPPATPSGDTDARDMQTLLDRRPKSAHQAALWIGDQLQDDLITYEVEHNVITFTLQNGETFRFVGEKCE